jgi:hypothetical protein
MFAPFKFPPLVSFITQEHHISASLLLAETDSGDDTFSYRDPPRTQPLVQALQSLHRPVMRSTTSRRFLLDNNHTATESEY